MWTLKPFPFRYSSRLKIPINSQRAVDSAMYSASVLLSAIRCCILLVTLKEEMLVDF